MMNEKWLEKYNLALAYFKKNGNSDIPLNFKTNDGINYDENGIQLGQWLSTQKKIHNGTAHYGSLDSKQEKLLEDIKIKWNRNKKSKESSWNHKYKLAKAYFEENGNSDIPLNFKTNDGIHYDENGIQLGQWLSTQKKIHNGTAHYGSLDSKQEKLLEDIKIKWNRNKKPRLSSWNYKYKLAKAYFEENGNLEIPMRFKTLDGIHYNENGESLGSWIQIQRQAKKKGNISDARKKDLDKIGMVWSLIGNNDYIPSSWMKNYELAKNFHDEYKNLRIQQNFKTLDGIHYDENGINLGSWIQTQRQIHNGKKNYKLNQKQIDLLEDIGMNWKGVYIFEKRGNEERNQKISSSWMKCYELAKKYREAYGDLRIVKSFKTNDGVNYNENGKQLGEWIRTQRKARKGTTRKELSQEQIDLLDDIDMIWSIRTCIKNQAVKTSKIIDDSRWSEINNLEDKKEFVEPIINEEEIIWKNVYDLAEKFFDSHQHLLVPLEFLTKNGNDYNPNGFDLGTWVDEQIEKHNKGLLSQDKKELLEKLRIDWNPKYKLRYNCNTKMYDVIKIDNSKAIDNESNEIIEDKCEQPKVIDLIEPINEEVSIAEESNETIDLVLEEACKEFDETIKRIQQEKDQLIEEYKNLVLEKQELEKRNKELDSNLNEVINELRDLNKKYILK